MARTAQNSSHKAIERYVADVRLQGGILTYYPVQINNALTVTGNVTSGGISTGTPATLASSATVSFTPSTSVTKHTPTQNETINFATPPAAGTEIWLEIVTSGTSSFTLTFGTNTKNQGTLTTGTVSAKTFIINFVSDGTNWCEVARTSAM